MDKLDTLFIPYSTTSGKIKPSNTTMSVDSSPNTVEEGSLKRSQCVGYRR